MRPRIVACPCSERSRRLTSTSRTRLCAYVRLCPVHVCFSSCGILSRARTQRFTIPPRQFDGCLTTSPSILTVLLDSWMWRLPSFRAASRALCQAGTRASMSFSRLSSVNAAHQSLVRGLDCPLGGAASTTRTTNGPQCTGTYAGQGCEWAYMSGKFAFIFDIIPPGMCSLAYRRTFLLTTMLSSESF